jgi:hypothetical protein
MSAGEFEVTRYQSNELDEIMPIRIQPETLALFVAGSANLAPVAAPTLGLFAQVTKNRNAYGVGCRSVTIKWTGEPPEGYKPGETLRIPVLQQTTYNNYIPGSTGNYLGSPVIVVSRSPENVR